MPSPRQDREPARELDPVLDVTEALADAGPANVRAARKVLLEIARRLNAL